MKILVACEESQRVCIAFRNKGHEAYSCDIQECSGGHPEWHIQKDALQVITEPGWDLITWSIKKNERAKVRSKTFPGIARAMAEQWG